MPNNGYFDTVFAVSGTTTPIPDSTQSNGTVSYTQGFPVSYSTPVSSGGYNFPRGSFNQLMNDITSAIQLMQQNGCFSFITTAMNGGTPYSYNLGATCVYDAGSGPEVWISTAASNTTTPGAMGANWNLLISSGRQRLTTNTTFYVATTGNDSNAGTSGSPWLTLQHAVNVLMDNYDLAGFTATISVATGTYTGNTSISGVFTGGGQVLIQGSGSPVLTDTGNAIDVLAGAAVQLAGLTIESGSGNGIHISQGGAVSLGTGMNFGECALAQVLCEFDGLFNTIGNNYTISGGGTNHINLKNGGNLDCNSGSSATVTISGSPVYSGAFIAATSAATALIVNYTWSGGITGQSFSVTYNGVINGVTGLPGSGDTQSTGGQFS